MRTPSSIVAAASVVIAACTGDAIVTAPSDPTTPPLALQPEIRLVVIDSTRLPFAGTAADRAAGHYAFQIRDTVPAIAPGDYVAGRQGGRFFGRVVSVSRGSGRLTLELAAAAWRDVFPPFKVHIPFTPGAGSAPSPYGTVRWGPWHVVRPSRPAQGRTPPAAPAIRTSGGALADLEDFNPVSFLLDNFDLCAASGAVTLVHPVTTK